MHKPMEHRSPSKPDRHYLIKRDAMIGAVGVASFTAISAWSGRELGMEDVKKAKHDYEAARDLKKTEARRACDYGRICDPELVMGVREGMCATGKCAVAGLDEYASRWRAANKELIFKSELSAGIGATLSAVYFVIFVALRAQMRKDAEEFRRTMPQRKTAPDQEPPRAPQEIAKEGNRHDGGQPAEVSGSQPVARNWWMEHSGPLTRTGSWKVQMDEATLQMRKAEKEVELAVRDICGSACSREVAFAIVAILSHRQTDLLLEEPSNLRHVLSERKGEFDKELRIYGLNVGLVLEEIRRREPAPGARAS